MRKVARRLYVSGIRKNLKFCVAQIAAEAEKILGEPCRTPDSDDIRTFWHKSGISRMTLDECIEKFGVTRQTIHNWRIKGGVDLRHAPAPAKAKTVMAVSESLDSLTHLSLSEVASMLNMPISAVFRIAKRRGITFARRPTVPPDDELVALAAGKSWCELADLIGCGGGAESLRGMLYRKRRQVIPRLQEVMRHTTTVPPTVLSQRKRKIAELGKKGFTVYAISKQVSCDRKTVKTCLQKAGKERPDEFYPPFGNKRAPSEPVDGSNGGGTD